MLKQKIFKVIILGVILLLIPGCGILETLLVSPSWEVYFTNPGKGDNKIVNVLTEKISKAKKSIHLAAFEFNLDPIASELIEAKERGVEVKFITDNKHGIKADSKTGHGQFAKLKKAGIEIKDDGRSGLMHNKFIIIDGEMVWTGSTNLTVNGTQKNNNNVIVMRSPVIANIYEQEFEEMWEGKYGKTSPSQVATQRVTVNGKKVAILFGPEDDVANKLISIIKSAKKEIKFMAFSFTHRALGDGMLKRAENGVKLQGIFEKTGSETKYSQLSPMFCEGIPVRQDGNSRTFHHKVIIIDRQLLVTGSFNFSNNANTSNDENLVIIENPQIARRYLQEFERRWEEGKDPDKAKIRC